MGHIMRAVAVGQELMRRGHRVELQAISDTAEHVLPAFPSYDGGEPDLLFFDMPHEIASWMVGWSGRIPVVALDYFGMVRPTLTISVLERTDPPPPGRRVCGLQYAIVRPEVLPSARPRETTGVLIVIGGEDAEGLGPQVARWFQSSDLQVTLVEGPSRRDRYNIEPRPHLEVVKNPPDLVKRMASCAWGITSGGVTMVEMMSLGKAVYAIPQTVHEDRLARHVFSQGGILGVGGKSFHIPTAMEITSIGRAASRLVDGGGLGRVCDAVEQLL
jgi:spore coat polysaccharide biosynthesis predicted glycosyltransferase SpsG